VTFNYLGQTCGLVCVLKLLNFRGLCSLSLNQNHKAKRYQSDMKSISALKGFFAQFTSKESRMRTLEASCCGLISIQIFHQEQASQLEN
jgi:hypothetical protein